ncbi:MAG: DUF3604 domain-containing protein [Halieaceae bacterium]|nr:DUF3604 domain-containing protein [Halieaceae bacterium]
MYNWITTHPKTTLVLLVFALLLLLAWFGGGKRFYDSNQNMSPESIAADYSKQDDSLIDIPELQRAAAPPYSPLKNVYWGDTHVHTRESFDATLFATRATVEDAYRFARGEKLLSPGGEMMQLSRPLDFVAITDHAEGFGLTGRCKDSGLNLGERVTCRLMTGSGLLGFVLLRGSAVSDGTQIGATVPAGEYQPTARTHPAYESFLLCRSGSGSPETCFADSSNSWAHYKKMADKYNDPGVLTTFSAYEFSPVLDAGGSEHRNVLFNGQNLPEHAFSSFDVGSAVELWQELEGACTTDCDFLTIPHNMNKGWGIYYSGWTWDGKPFTAEDWRLRQRREPIAEMYQVKGSSECALGAGATDEECSFSQVLEPCEDGETLGCAFNTSFVREGFKVGLQLERDLGFNPLRFGMIGSTDTHNGNAGDTEEWDFVGKGGAATSPAVRRFTANQGENPYQSVLKFHTSGGLAAVWAEENTRDAIFSAMQRREVYATSGPRISLRFFAGWGFDEDIANTVDAIPVATAGGVPMGGLLTPDAESQGSPTFFVWAGADPLDAPLQRVQLIKGWIDDNGKTHEIVRDIACSDGLQVDPQTRRCPDNGASVDTATCKFERTTGAPQLVATWQDPEFDASQAAFYYTRVIQNPSCRWSTYDAIRLGIELSPKVPATIRERAWSSPIWFDPGLST